MADVRSLLRQQRVARRIEHPLAAYSDAGKLLCTLCREQIKAETLWDGHLRGEAHKTRLRQREAAKANGAQAQRPSMESTEGAQKRKLSEAGVTEDDVDMEDADEPARRKRTRPDPIDTASSPPNDGEKSASTPTGPTSKDQASTPPPRPAATAAALTRARRTSGTPSQGVELQIPSRPATPAHRDSSSSSATPGAGPASYFPDQRGAPTRQATTLLVAATANTGPTPSRLSAETTKQNGTVDEAEWAAFEADIASASAPFSSDAVISAPAVSASAVAEAQARANDEGAPDRDEQRRQADLDKADAKEEAARALEDEFEEMEGLEERVRRLKEKREALARRKAESQSQEARPAGHLGKGPQGKENADGGEDAEEEDDSEDDDGDEWDGFRFRA